MEIIDLDTSGAVRHERCACHATWWRLPDDRWLLVARRASATPPAKAATAAVWAVASASSAKDTPRYAAVEVLDDPRPHLSRHAASAYLLGHPEAGPLVPAVGPTVARIMADAKHAGLVPFLDKRGALVIGSAGTPGRVIADELRARLTEYAELIRGHLAGEPVPCAVGKCTEHAERLAVPARPLCARHVAEVVRDAVIPDAPVALPEPSPITGPREPTPVEVSASMYDLIEDQRQRGERPYAAGRRR